MRTPFAVPLLRDNDAARAKPLSVPNLGKLVPNLIYHGFTKTNIKPQAPVPPHSPRVGVRVRGTHVQRRGKRARPERGALGSLAGAFASFDQGEGGALFQRWHVTPFRCLDFCFNVDIHTISNSGFVSQRCNNSATGLYHLSVEIIRCRLFRGPWRRCGPFCRLVGGGLRWLNEGS